jgi:hypothetical protein
MWHVSGVSCLFEYYTVFFLSLCTSLSFEEKSHASHTTKTNVLTKTAIANINRNSDDGYLKKLTVKATLRCCALTLTVRLNSCTYGCPLSGAVYWPTLAYTSRTTGRGVQASPESPIQSTQRSTEHHCSGLLSLSE